MSTTDWISVITPTYNSASYITETIASVQAQTHQQWEMLIVDDCSRDNTREIVQAIAEKDDRIKLICLLENKGAAFARNKALEQAGYRYVAFLDSDDVWMPDKLRKQCDFMVRNNIAFSFTSYRIISEDGMQTGRYVEAPFAVTYSDLLKNTIIGCLTVMLDRMKVGNIRMPEIRTRQDTALWLSILKRGFTAYGMQEELSMYRKVNGSISSNKFKAAQNTWKVYRDIEKLNFPYACWCFSHYALNALRKSRKKGILDAGL